MTKKRIVNLRFDDAPMEPCLQGKQDRAGSSANVLDLWEENKGHNRTIECAQAVAAILINNPEMIKEYPFIDTVEKALEDALVSARSQGERQSTARLTALKKAVNSKNSSDTQCMNNKDTKDTIEKPLKMVKDVFLFREDRTQWDDLQLKQTCQEYRDTRKNRDQMIHFRTQALEYVLEKRFDKAETIYRFFIESGFEIPGTSCHLARIMLMTDRIEKVTALIEAAWKHRDQAPSYVITRIFFFKIVLGMLHNKDTSENITFFNNSLENQEEYMTWTIEPALDCILKKIGRDNHGLLLGLANDINNDPGCQ